MQAVVKTPHTEFVMNGDVPRYFIEEAIRIFGKESVLLSDDGYINPFETDWYRTLDVDETPGGNLRFYRKQSGLTQKQLGDRLGIAPQFVSNMEHNSKPISRKMACRLASLFRVPVSRFII